MFMNAQSLKILSVQKSVLFFDNWVHATLYVMGMYLFEKLNFRSNHCIKPRSQSSQQHHEINEIIASKRIKRLPKRRAKVARSSRTMPLQERNLQAAFKHIKTYQKATSVTQKKFTQLMIEGCLQRIASDHDDGGPSPSKFPCKAYRKWQGSTCARTFKCLSGLMLAECAWLQLQSLYHP